MTEIPEHLLQRSRERREALGLSQSGTPEGDAAPAATPAVSDAAAAPAPAAAPRTPAPAPAPPPPPPPKPDPPYVAAAKARRRIPWWAMPALAGLPVWAFVYALTLEPTESGPADPLALGEEVYSANCASCHGGGGAGGSGPALAEGAVLATWPNWQDQVAWVALGSADWPHETYGATEKPVNGGMPGWASQLTPEEIALVVRFEREELGGGEPEPELVALTEAIAAEAPETAEGADVAATLQQSQAPGDGPGGTRPPPAGG